MEMNSSRSRGQRIMVITLSHYTLRLAQRWKIPQFPLRASSRPAAWAMSLPNWTTTEHMSWMFCVSCVFCVVTVCGVLDGGGALELGPALATLGLS